ncbi:MAG: hypothetical protein SVP52_03835, partial [Chloroflexota bacterium]|nr:hypothetical protein [Chloroflexota bacterium]
IMGKIGHGYGSDWHLLRFLGYHREYFTKQILTEIGGDAISWLDFKFSYKNKKCGRDTEYNGLEFIKNLDILRNWHAFWPTSGRSQNWDAVGKIKVDGHEEWLLVEAKAHTHELKGSGCGATNPRSIEKIERALEKTKSAFGAASTPFENWYKKYYQYANRLAALYFLTEECNPPVPARLLFIYFLGDKHKSQDCPQDSEGWESGLAEMEAVLGIDRDCALYQRVQRMFLHVNPKAKTN